MTTKRITPSRANPRQATPSHPKPPQADHVAFFRCCIDRAMYAPAMRYCTCASGDP